MEYSFIVPGLSLGLLLTVVFALYGINQQNLRNLEERLLQEATRFKENAEKSERRLDETARLAEQRLKDETSRVETRLGNLIEHRIESSVAKLTQVIVCIEETLRLFPSIVKTVSILEVELEMLKTTIQEIHSKRTR